MTETSSESGSVKGSQRCLQMAKARQWPAVETVIPYVRKSRDFTELLARDEETGMNLMMYACKDNRRAVYDALVEFGFSIHESAKDGMTALHYATSSTADVIVQDLISHGAEVMGIAGPKFQTPLHIACQRPSSAMIMAKCLLSRMHKRGRLITDGLGNLPVTYAVETGNDVLVQELLKDFPTEQTGEWRQRGTGNTLLHLATIRRDAKVAETLIDVGKSDLTAQNNDGKTVLHISCENNDDKLVRLFCQRKANGNILDKWEESPLHAAIRNGNTTMVVMLADWIKTDVQIRKSDGCTLMHLSAERGYIDCVKVLCSRDVPLHMPNKLGILSLHLAAQNGFPEVVKILLDKGAPLDARTKERYTPMHLAVLHNRPDVIQLLMGCGASVAVQGGPSGELALHIAARRNAVDCAKMLLLTGAKVNAPTGNEGETALHIAARQGFSSLVTLLLSEGADVHLASKTGQSALHIAVLHSQYGIVKQILAHVKKELSRKDVVKLVNMANAEGETALHYACGLTENSLHFPLEDTDITRTLLKNGADPMATTKFTLEQPLHYSGRVGNMNTAIELADFMGHNFPPLTNKQARNGWSPMLTACYHGHDELVEFLTSNTARVDIFDEQGFSALHLAARNGFEKCCHLLLGRKAFVNIKTKSSITPIHLAAANGFEDVVFMLVDKYHASIDVTTLDKKTPLHLAAANGHKRVAKILIDLKANVNANDSYGQTPLHIAAEYDHPDVVEMFLKFNPQLVFKANQDGMTCAHIAAAKGSVAVLKELLRFNKSVVITARNKTTESLPLHLAAENGHAEVVKILIAAGSTPRSENVDGMTCIHLAAKEGHSKVLAAIPPTLSWGIPSDKTGLTPLHVAVFYSQIEMVREMVAKVPPDISTEKPKYFNLKDEKLQSLIMIDVHLADILHGLTPLHVASYAGVDQAVRLLLNFSGVEVDAVSAVLKTTPLHLAAQQGNLSVSGLLLAQSSELMKLQDSRGLKPLHLASRNGHTDMAASLISQGCDINVSDNHGWVPLHHATRCGQLSVVRLLLDLGASVTHATRDDRVPLSLSAASGHVDVFMYLLQKEHNTEMLLEDKKFILDLMKCGRANQQKAIEEFILVSKCPVETAAKLSYLFLKRSEVDLEHQKDLELAAMFCEKLTGQLMDVASVMSSPSRILRATDPHGTAFIDVLVGDQLKECVAESAVQRYLTDVWEGDLGLSSSALGILFLAFIFFPPVLFYCSLPFGQKYHKVPMIKFMASAASHIQFILIQCSVAVVPFYPNSQRDNFWPTWNEYVLLLWLAGNLTAELTNPSNGNGGRFVRTMTLGLSSVAALLQVMAITYPVESHDAQMLMYCRNIILSFPVMISVLTIIEILTFSKSFGPLTIILTYMIQESSVAMTIMFVFFVGWWLQIQTIYTAICPDIDRELTQGCTCNIRVPKGCSQPFTKDNNDRIVPGCWTNEQLVTDSISVEYILGVMHGALFQHEDFLWYPAIRNTPEGYTWLVRIHMALFHIVMVLILLMLVVSISADTLERLMASSDLEWQFERAKLIRNMSKTAPTPSPLNIFVKPFVYLKAFIKRKGLLCTSYAPYYIMLEEGIGDQGELAAQQTQEEDDLWKQFKKWAYKILYSKRIDAVFQAAASVHSRFLFSDTKQLPKKEIKKIRKAAKKEKARRKQEEWQANELLHDVINWSSVVERYRELAEEESEDEYIDQLDCYMSELELWQADMWEEADDIEDVEERLMLREWLVEEFKDVVKTS